MRAQAGPASETHGPDGAGGPWHDGRTMRPAVRLRHISLLALGVQIGLAACRPGGAPEATMNSADASSTFTLTSPEFGEGQSIPRRYACDGDDVSPPLAWSGSPGDTAAFVLVMDDPDASGFIHWVVI